VRLHSGSARGTDPGARRARLGIDLLAIALVAALFGALPAAALATPFASPRAYELVSPAEKGGADVEAHGEAGSNFMPMTSAEGSRVSFTSLNAIPGSVGNLFDNTYLAERGASEWTTSFLTPPVDPLFNIPAAIYEGFSGDLGKAVFQWGAEQEPRLTAEAPEGTAALYLRDNLTGTYRLLTPGAPANEASFSPKFEDASTDFSHVVMQVFNSGTMQPEAPSGANPVLYEWNAETGGLALVGHLPDGSLPGVELAYPAGMSGISPAPWNPVSADGSHVFFVARPVAAIVRLYVRVNATTTKWVSEPKTTTPDPNGERDVNFRFASTDGTKAFFTSAEKLTDDATTGATDEGSDLYRWDEGGETLTDITVDPTDANGAEVQGVLGGAADGSDLFFVAKGALAPGATAGQNNLYVWHEGGSAAGTVEFVAGPLPNNADWIYNGTNVFNGRIPVQVTADGSRLLFAANTSLTGYPNEGFWESYLYDADTGELTCATCNPSGEPATGNALAVGSGDYLHRARSLTADGEHVFFTSPEQLVPADTNSVADAYEYDAESGEIALISSGKAETPSLFSDASESGEDVFFATRQRLVGIDQDENVDAYDARVGGGLADQNPSSSAPGCTGQECRSPVAASAAATAPASSQLNGPGNQRRKHHKKKHRHHKRKGHAKHRRAHHKRGQTKRDAHR
jgi:hypothetical protein